MNVYYEYDFHLHLHHILMKLIYYLKQLKIVLCSLINLILSSLLLLLFLSMSCLLFGLGRCWRRGAVGIVGIGLALVGGGLICICSSLRLCRICLGRGRLRSRINFFFSLLSCSIHTQSYQY